MNCAFGIVDKNFENGILWQNSDNVQAERTGPGAYILHFTGSFQSIPSVATTPYSENNNAFIRIYGSDGGESRAEVHIYTGLMNQSEPTDVAFQFVAMWK